MRGHVEPSVFPRTGYRLLKDVYRLLRLGLTSQAHLAAENLFPGNNESRRHVVNGTAPIIAWLARRAIGLAYLRKAEISTSP